MAIGRLAGDGAGSTTLATFTAVDEATDAVANASATVYLPMANAIAFVLDVTAAADGVDDTCDVYVQTLLGAAFWVDVVHFTQVTGTSEPDRYIAKVCSQLATAEFDNATGLGAAAVRNIMGDAWRVYCTVVDGGVATAEAFTFTVTAIPM
ncbi:MAG TPA: hypothetical protein VIH00_02835 [Candidatus Limnocylindrales bacterium]